MKIYIANKETCRKVADLFRAKSNEIASLKRRLKTSNRKLRDAEDWIKALNEINRPKPSKKAV